MPEQPATPLTWSEDMGTGIEPIDLDHAAMIGLFNRAASNLQNDNNPVEFGQLIADLYDHSRLHFRKEEALMRACAYPDIHPHQQEHRQFIDTLESFLQAPVGLGEPDNAHRLFDFLLGWLQNHLLHTDQDYVRYTVDHEADILTAIDAAKKNVR